MDYHEAVNTLEGLRRLRPKLGTDTTASLLAVHGNPHEELAAVQVAGSNGKGSTARLLDSILRESGLTVGLYTSPDLHDLRERIRVQGEKIPKHEVIQFVRETWPTIVDRAAEGDAPTFFEAFTAMALWHFAREDVDVAILEVGIGGRYDATSVVDPVAAAVTTVSLEHTDILGSTVEEIARDKAQVTPADRPLVTGATGAGLETIREVTDVITVTGKSHVDGEADANTPSDSFEEGDVRATETEMYSPTEAGLSLSGPDWSIETKTPLLGDHQALNAGIAATLARQVTDPTERDIALGIRNVTWPGRFEVMERDPLVVLDGAHNPDACRRLSTLLARFDCDDLVLVFGAMRDKDHAAMAQALPDADRLFLAEPDVERAADSDVLGAVLEREIDVDVTQAESVLDALDRARESADEGDCVVVTGSLYTVAEARDRWIRTATVVQTASRTSMGRTTPPSDVTARAQSVMHRADVPATVRRRRADRFVHRTVRLDLRRATVADVKETMLSLGGTCAVSGIETADESVGVVLGGTLDQFRSLIDQLNRPGQYRYLARQLATQVGLDTLTTPLSDEAEATDSRTSAAPVGSQQSGQSKASHYPWADGPAVMGILNVTPDSFHDGGQYESGDAAVSRAEAMVEAGVDIIDIGGESTRPGADPVSPETERDRVVPVVESLSSLDVLLSVDTRKPDVAQAALEAGADIVNDVTGLADAEMRHIVAEWDVPVVVMHSLSAPVDPERRYEYDDVVSHVRESLAERLLLAERAGIDRSQVLVDPGLGFGKRASESFELLDRLDELQSLGAPILVGHSHKSMFGDLPHGDGDDRLAHTLAATALAVDRGADVIRVHDVPENVAAVETAVRTTRRQDTS